MKDQGNIQQIVKMDFEGYLKQVASENKIFVTKLIFKEFHEILFLFEQRHQKAFCVSSNIRPI